MSKNTRTCKGCGKKYEYGYWGTGFKYCSTSCQKIQRLAYQKLWYSKNQARLYPKDKTRMCELCKRNISSVGQRKRASRFCSKRCMLVSQNIRYQHTNYVVIRIPVEDIPFLFGDKK